MIYDDFASNIDRIEDDHTEPSHIETNLRVESLKWFLSDLNIQKRAEKCEDSWMQTMLGTPVDFVPRLADAEHRVAGEDFISLKSVGIAKPLDSKPRRRMKFIQLQTNQHKTSKKHDYMIDTANYNNLQQSMTCYFSFDHVLEF